MPNNQNKPFSSTLVPILVSGLVGALLVAGLVYVFYQSPQLAKYQQQLDMMKEQIEIQRQPIGIMNESLLKHEQLELEVVPRYDLQLDTWGNGSYKMENITLMLSRTESTVFHVYFSNVGNSVAHLLYWTVSIWTPNSISSGYNGPMNDIQNIVLAPYGLYNVTYTFNPPIIPNNDRVVLTFALMSTESVVYETVNATFRQ